MCVLCHGGCQLRRWLSFDLMASPGVMRFVCLDQWFRAGGINALPFVRSRSSVVLPGVVCLNVSLNHVMSQLKLPATVAGASTREEGFFFSALSPLVVQ